MPGPIVHLIVQDRLPPFLQEMGGKPGKEFADLLKGEPCSPYAAFGSMGPDFLFFSLKEYGTPLDELVNFYFKVYDALKPFIEFYEKYIEPVKQALDDALAALDKALFQGLISQIQDTASLITTTLLTAVEVLVTKKIDLFYPFYPKVQQGEPEDKWYWFDFLHDRRTGQFASTMWKMAQGDKDLMRYCLGYASHIGVDVVGHSFVNAVVGGPYRTHWHRHKLVENWIDAYARNYYPDDTTRKGCLSLESEDIYIPNGIAGSYYYRLCEFPDEKLPEKLGKMFLEAMNQVYSHPCPVGFNVDDLDTTYRLWLKWFEYVTSIGSAQKPTPVPPPGAATMALINDYTSGFPSPPGHQGGGSFSLWGIFEAIFGFVKWLVEVLVYTFTWIISHIDDIFLLPLTEALAVLKWFLYQIQKAIYEIYDNLRFLLVLGGYLFPEPQDLQKLPYGKAFLNTAYVQLMGGVAANFNLYPRKQEAHALLGTTEHHLIYTGTLQELDHAEPAPKPFHGAFPEAFISKGYKYDPQIVKLYDCIGPYGNSDKYTHFIDKNTWNTGQLGCALAFCARLIGARMENLPNFNLDADRGYGWKTWRAKDPKNIEASNPVPVDYIDA